MTIYNTGTATITAGSATVTGTGTAWSNATMAGCKISLNANSARECVILSVQSPTSLTLTRPALAAQAGTGAYEIDLNTGDEVTMAATRATLAGLVNSIAAIQGPPLSGLQNSAAFSRDLWTNVNVADWWADLNLNSGNSGFTDLIRGSIPQRLNGTISTARIADLDAFQLPGSGLSTQGPLNAPNTSGTPWVANAFWHVEVTSADAPNLGAGTSVNCVQVAQQSGGTRRGERERQNGVWGAWRELPNTLTDLNTRFLPTRGSNANGDFIRFADGTQICTTTQTRTDIAIASSTPTLFNGFWGLFSWTYPAAFIATPALSAGQCRHGSALNFISPLNSTLTTGGLLLLDNVASRAAGENCTISAMAIGRWQ